MITIWTRVDSIPDGTEIVKFNDAFFDLYTKDLVGTEQDLKVIAAIDGAVPAEYLPYYRTPFGVTRPENFSTGCKTVLNVLHHPSRLFDTVECGENAVQCLVGVDGVCFVSEYMPVRLHVLHPMLIDGVVIENDTDYVEWWGDRYESD